MDRFGDQAIQSSIGSHGRIENRVFRIQNILEEKPSQRLPIVHGIDRMQIDHSNMKEPFLYLSFSAPIRGECISLKPAGAMRTSKREGNINNAIGMSILIGALWASSSARCLLFKRI